ncbi:MAG: SAF domain-containing protein [Bacillota bacterium]|nr:SAF domain-containing protein [Bacillota bacterium]
MKKVVALQLHSDDDVATLLMDAEPGNIVCVRGKDGQLKKTIALINRIPKGHKIAVREIRSGHMIKKYGEIIGIAKGLIQKGALVDINNLESQRGRGDQIE